MPVERTVGGTSLIDVLDRVLDKGIVIDAWVRVSLVGIDLITVEARVVVASIETYLKYSEAVGQLPPVSKPAALEPARAAGDKAWHVQAPWPRPRRRPERAPARRRPAWGWRSSSSPATTSGNARASRWNGWASTGACARPPASAPTSSTTAWS